VTNPLKCRIRCGFTTSAKANGQSVHANKWLRLTVWSFSVKGKSEEDFCVD